ncbi:MAG: hypothetical protein QOG62_2791 [Thermoleophilaceae bacterium]|nr:hypothetical protein [Thermoleophilaceae bacterium]
MTPDPANSPPDLELRLIGEGELVEVAGASVRAIAGVSGLAPERLTRLRVVVEELVREARGRERAGTGDEAVTIRVRREPGRLSIEVSDLALPVDPAQTAQAASRRLASLGFVDELEIAAHGREGNVSTCTVNLGGPDEGALGVEMLGPDTPAATDADSLEIRRMMPDDALGLARCIYRCYGYSYKTALLYEPGQVAEALRKELMRSIVAVTPGGEVVGHCALFVEREGDRVPEAGRMVVDPRYRGHHLAQTMADARLGIARGAGRVGFWAEAVTNHPGSQKEVIRLGATEVGLLIGASPADVAMAGIENTNQGRRTLLATYTPLIREPQLIHVPKHHRDFIATLAARMEMEREMGTGAASAAGTTELVSRIQPEVGVAHLVVSSIGADVVDRVAGELDGFDAFDLSAVHLDIPLADPSAAPAGEALERLGFCLGAWLPDFADSGDVLRLQRVGDRPVDVEHIVCARAEGEEVRDHVVSEWRRVRRGGTG